MLKLKEISSEEMVSVFLKAELNSDRWKKTIQALLQKYAVSDQLITNSDLQSAQENKLRDQILGDFRGYKKNKDLFESFPSEVEWWRVELSKEEIQKVKYMKYDYWEELSKGTRLASESAQTILNGETVFGQDNSQFIKAAENFKNGFSFPELILVARDLESSIVVLEGHLRLTSMILELQSIPDRTEVIIGFSSNIENWGGY